MYRVYVDIIFYSVYEKLLKFKIIKIGRDVCINGYSVESFVCVVYFFDLV